MTKRNRIKIKTWRFKNILKYKVAHYNFHSSFISGDLFLKKKYEDQLVKKYLYVRLGGLTRESRY